MATKFLSLYLLVVASLLVGTIQAGTSTSHHLVHPNPSRQFADGMHEIAPLTLDQRDEVGTNIAGRAPGSVSNPSDVPAKRAGTSAS